jgi:hypothetical protein
MDGNEKAGRSSGRTTDHSDGLDDDFFDQGITIAIKETVGNVRYELNSSPLNVN